jgi:hypothetical protein
VASGPSKFDESEPRPMAERGGSPLRDAWDQVRIAWGDTTWPDLDAYERVLDERYDELLAPRFTR